MQIMHKMYTHIKTSIMVLDKTLKKKDFSPLCCMFMCRIKWYCKKQVTMISFHKDMALQNKQSSLSLAGHQDPHGAQKSVIFSCHNNTSI